MMRRRSGGTERGREHTGRGGHAILYGLAAAVILLLAGIPGFMFFMQGREAAPLPVAMGSGDTIHAVKQAQNIESKQPLPSSSVRALSPAPAGSGKSARPSGDRSINPRETTLAVTDANRSVKGEELSRHETKLGAEGPVMRVRVLRTDMKYPLVRVQEEVEKDAATGEEKAIRMLAMTADHVMVKLRPGATEEDLQALTRKYAGKIRSKKPLSGIYLVELAESGADAVPGAVAKYLQESGVVALAEPDYLVFATETQLMPDDPRFGELWGMHNTGQTNGTVDADIDAPEAWSICTGDRGVLVGVIDTGADYTHPDLGSNYWSNPGETGLDAQSRDKRSNGVDDDGNGYIDDWRGWNFITETNDPKDDHFHGTHCSGTIGGVGSNGVGVAGVCWKVSIVALKFLSGSGSGNISDAIEATAYATKVGCDLTSNSWGGSGFSQAMIDAIAAANSNGVLFVAAAGNSSNDADEEPMYPAAYNQPNIISVAATDRNDGLASFSNYGAVSVDLGAPGHQILSTYPTYMTSAMSSRGDPTNYQSISGTSMATPHVAGACALLKSFDPTITHADIKTYLLRSGDRIPALNGKTLSGARMNIGRAMQWRRDGRALLTVESVAIADGTVPGSSGNSNGVAEIGERVALTVQLKNMGTSASSNGVMRLESTDGLPAVIIVNGAVNFDPIPAATNASLAQPLIVEFSPSYEASYVAKLTLVCEESDGVTWTEPLSISINFRPASGAVAWGMGNPGNPLVSSWQQSTPVGIWRLNDGVRDLAVGGHCLALKTNGTVWAWGTGTDGQLGLGTNVSAVVPTMIPDLSDVLAVAAGGSHSLALKSDGTVWACGGNTYGQLGNGTTNRAGQPVQVPGISNIRAIAAGGMHSLAAGSDGTVWAWGGNTCGQLGIGTTNGSLDPVRVTNLAGVASLTAGYQHSLALKTNGTVSAWGYNANGQLGNNTTNNQTQPVQVSGLSNVRRLAAGYYHSVAVKSDGTLWAWGNNSYGQLGDGGYTTRTTPVQAQVSGVSNAACGYSHGLALKTNGTVWAWGYNYYGQLGNGSNGWDATSLTPVRVTNLSNAVGVAAGSYGSYAFLPGGSQRPNGPPGIQSGSIWMAEDTPATCAYRAYDPDDDPLTYQMTLLPRHGTVTGTPPNMVYLPATNFSGVDEFRYKANDGQHDSNEAKITVSIWALNDAPVILAGPTATPPSPTVEESVVFSVTAMDVESNTLTYAWDLGDATTGATANVTHSYNANGTFLASVVISDGVGGVSTGTVAVTVTGGTNWAPIAVNESFTLVEDTPLTMDAPGLLGNDVDPDADPLTAILVTPPAKGTVELSADGSFTYTPSNNYYGADFFVYKPNDGKADGNFGRVDLTITAVNDVPVASNMTITVSEDGSKSFTLAASDAEKYYWSLTYTLLSSPSNGTLTGSSYSRTYKPNANFNGTDTFTFRVNDGEFDSSVATGTITVTSVNDVPTVTAGASPSAGIVPLVVTFSASGTDVDGDTLSYSWVFGDGVTSTNRNPVHTYTNSGYFPARVTVSDGHGGSASASPAVSVDAPDGLMGHWKLDETNGTAVADSSLTANNGTLVNGPSWTEGKVDGGLSFDGSNDSVTVASPRYSGIVNTFTIAFWANPGAGRTATSESTSGTAGTSGQRYAIYPTQGTGAYGSGHAGAGVSVGTNGVSVFEHADGYLPSVLALSTAVTGWTHVAVVYVNGTPKLYLNGLLARTGLAGGKSVHPGCGMGGSSYGWYQGGLDEVRMFSRALTMREVQELAGREVTNRPPVAVDDSATVVRDTGGTIQVLANDSDLDDDTLTIAAVTQPAHGTVSNSATQVSYVPGAFYLGPDTFTYTISDGYGGVATGTVSVTVAETIPGLAYEYYQGSWAGGGYLPAFDSLAPVTSGVVSTFSLAPRLRDTDFAFRFRGKLAIATGGSYTFYTSSDDGSTLYIDGSLMVTNDGPHGIVKKAGVTNLSAGLHDIEARFCQGTGGWGLTVSWAGPGIAEQEIPSNVLFRAAAGGSSDMNANGMPDAWEIASFGSTNAINGGPLDDWDHDGMSNLSEYRAGTLATNALSVLALGSCQPAEGANLVIRWQSVMGKLYTIRLATNLVTGFNNTLTNHIPGVPPENSYTTTVDQAGTLFYRVTVE
ncbi:MAG: hypothetical protein C0404_03770 [Verrucomicrobia bacterium]|nr:hypothetical protein [Verrucomicrobiota bacterium]